jgi:hypothetical protein
MIREILLSLAAFSAFSVACTAQTVAPVIRLPASESANARKAVQDYRAAFDRNQRATAAWNEFNQNYRSAHPELPDLRFSSDFRLAFAKKISADPLPWGRNEITTIELSDAERRRADALHREFVDAASALEKARMDWLLYEHQFVLDHIGPSREGAIITLPDGKSAMIAPPWASGIEFSTDFQTAVPAY